MSALKIIIVVTAVLAAAPGVGTLLIRARRRRHGLHVEPMRRVRDSRAPDTRLTLAAGGLLIASVLGPRGVLGDVLLALALAVLVTGGFLALRQRRLSVACCAARSRVDGNGRGDRPVT